MDYETSLKEVIQGNSVLFLGAGFSDGALTVEGKPLLKSRELARYLCERMNLEPTDDLTRASDDFLYALNDTDEAVRILKSLYQTKSVTTAHQSIASIPWRSVFTTNYDCVYEQARKNVGKTCASVDLSFEPRAQSVSTQLVVHINGSIETLDKHKLQVDFKLSNTSYLTADFITSPWSDFFTSELETADSIFFVGYSLYDLDIQRLLYSHQQLKEKTFFVSPKPKRQSDVRVFENFGVFVEADVKRFATDLVSATEGQQFRKKDIILTSFEETELGSYRNVQAPNYGDSAFSLFTRGEYDNALILQSILDSSKSKYYIVRKELWDIFSLIKEGKAKNILVESEFGNGKTLLLAGIKALCAYNKIPCYELIEETDKTLLELDKILNETGKQVLIIEGYPNYVKSLRRIAVKRPANLILLVSERTALNAIHHEKLFKIIGEHPILFTLDVLDRVAIEQLIDIFEEHGFWDVFAKLSPDRKKTKILVAYNNSIANFLLGFFHSPDLKQRLGEVYTSVAGNNSFKDIITGICIFGVIGKPVQLQKLVRLVQSGLTNTIVFQSNPSVKQLVASDSMYPKLKSSLYARFLLAEFGNAKHIVTVLLKIYATCADDVRFDKWFRDVLRELDKFSNIQSMLPAKNRLIASKDYYEGIKSLNNNRHHYHYWFQYAICRTVFQDFDLAEKLFATAYSLYDKQTGGRRIPHLMLDNQYSRFLMLRALSQPELYANFETFRRANEIVNRQAAEFADTQDFPYRGILLYKQFYQEAKSRFSEEEKNIFHRQVKHLLKVIQRLPSETQKSRYILEALESLTSLDEVFLGEDGEVSMEE